MHGSEGAEPDSQTATPLTEAESLRRQLQIGRKRLSCRSKVFTYRLAASYRAHDRASL